jgi:monovalent cation:H+ antiporter-2, CPA2 family
MGEADFVLTLAAGLAAALVLGYITQRIKLSPIVGYLIAGIILGPATPGFDADREIASQFAEVGIILLMFGVGLQFHFKELLAVRRVAIPGALAHTIVISALGGVVMIWAGEGLKNGLAFGFALSMASTVVLVRTLSDSDHLHTPVGHLTVGWEVLKDLFTVVALVLIPLFYGDAAATMSGGALQMLWALLKIAGLVVFTVFVGVRLIPWLLGRVAATHSRELFTLTILAVALTIAVGSARIFGVSYALGALLAGLVVGRSDFSFRAASEALPMRDAFAVLFFVSVGMLFDPAVVARSPGLLLMSIALVLVAKPLVSLVVCAVAGLPSKVSLGAAAALAQIGEFSFVLMALGSQMGFLSDSATNAIIGAAIVSISINALVYRTVAPLDRALFRSQFLWKLLNFRVPASAHTVPVGRPSPEADAAYRAVIVGHGPVGGTVTRLLRDQGVEPTIIEMNLQTVQRLKQEGTRAIFGDATLPTILEQAGVSDSGTLVLSVSGFTNAPEVIKMARVLNPRIHILARAAHLADVPALRGAGADQVFSGEGEVALGMTEYVLTQLGATPEQIDRERERVHGELF